MSSSGFFIIGANHQTAPMEVRERLSLPESDAEAFQRKLAGVPGLSEFAILSTCNRIEIYGVAANAEAVSSVQEAFCTNRQFTPAEFEQFRLGLWNLAAIQHLLAVATGLESQMLGETEIFGQVKDAYAAAQGRGTTGPILNRIFQKTFQSAKFVRSHTGITEGQVSVANVAVELAANIFGSLAQVKILLLGAGEIGERTAKAFQSRGAENLTVASRRMERAMELAQQLGGKALPFEQREAHLHEFDVIVGSTAAPGLMVTAEAVSAAMLRRKSRPLFLIDLALPRDIDPAVAGRENVYLYNLDDLARIAEQNRAARESELSKCRALLESRAEGLWHQVAGRMSAMPAAKKPVNSSEYQPDKAQIS